MSAPKSAGKPDRTGASARMLALMGLLFAAAAALRALESALPEFCQRRLRSFGYSAAFENSRY